MQVFQVAFSAGLLLWAVFMVVRLLAGGYDFLYVVFFSIIAALGCGLLKLSIKEMKGGEE